MKLIRTILFLGVFLFAVAVGIVIAAPQYPQAAALAQKLQLYKLQPVANTTIATAGQIQKQLPQLGSVLGIKTEDPAQTKLGSLPQKTIEYARYLYCQGVVEDYAARNLVATPAASVKK